MSRRKQTFQNISWFLDLRNRELLEMDPEYQRRSVWNQEFRESFVDTVLLGYPSPAIFLFRRVAEDGVTTYDVVDGKQRLSSIFDFMDGEFPISERSPVSAHRGKYFSALPKEKKLEFYDYDFSVELLPTNEASVVNIIFDRLNRNVARLSKQELRHARFNGRFITQAEELADWMSQEFPTAMPRIAPQSRRQMKDVELTASLLLFLEVGPKGYSADALDEAFKDRDEDWQQEQAVTEEFRIVVGKIKQLMEHHDGQFIAGSRLHNQADFYSLFAAIAELLRDNEMPDDDESVPRLASFVQTIESCDGELPSWAESYLQAAKSASNDLTPRNTRITCIKQTLLDIPIDVGA